MPGQAYEYSNTDAKTGRTAFLYSHILCGDEHAKPEGGEGQPVTDEQILKFRRDMEALMKKEKGRQV
jgi:hypothetical protein